MGGLLSLVWTHHAYGIEFDLLHRQYAKQISSFSRDFLKNFELRIPQIINTLLNLSTGYTMMHKMIHLNII